MMEERVIVLSPAEREIIDQWKSKGITVIQWESYWDDDEGHMHDIATFKGDMPYDSLTDSEWAIEQMLWRIAAMTDNDRWGGGYGSYRLDLVAGTCRKTGNIWMPEPELQYQDIDADKQPTIAIGDV